MAKLQGRPKASHAILRNFDVHVAGLLACLALVKACVSSKSCLLCLPSLGLFSPHLHFLAGWEAELHRHIDMVTRSVRAHEVT
jgi:hypothetical protein